VVHPRYLDEYLTPGDYNEWAAFLTWLYEKRNDA
jgi:hypothetical protein